MTRTKMAFGLRVGFAVLALLATTAAQGQVRDMERFAAPPPTADEVFLQLTDPLGNAPHYCTDIPGWGVISAGRDGWQTGWPLEAHSCKTQMPKPQYFIVDQLVSKAELTGSSGRIRFTRFDLCAEIMQAGGSGQNTVREDAWILLTTCNDGKRQQFDLTAKGELRSRLDPNKCFTIGIEAHEAGNRAPGDPWYQRALTMSACADADATRQAWTLKAPNIAAD